ncbi:MAG: lamin tail domain-containing protein [bacterium]|nr:lamin tail domain-containing protein [bacterium]
MWKYYLSFTIIILFSPASFILAGVMINEVMYDLPNGSDEGREWVEVYNNGNEPVDFSTYKFFEADTNHKLISVTGGENIPSLGYALIVSDAEKFKKDNSGFFGVIFDSTFSLSNTGEVLMLKDEDLNIIDQYTYQSSQGGGGEGHSLQKISGVWRGEKPTPGVENKISYTLPSPKVLPVPAKVSNIASIARQDLAIDIPPVTRSNLVSEGPESASNSYIFIIIFVILIFGGGGAVYIVRRKKNTSKISNDFEIFDK